MAPANWRFRRSELAALDVGDVLPTDDGLVVKLRRSKTDPEGKRRRHPLWIHAINLPGAVAQCLDDDRRHLRRSVVSRR
jgi:integrase